MRSLMPPRRIAALFLASLPMFCAACSGVTPAPVVITKIKEVPQPVPADLLSCSAEPKAPAILDDITTAALIADLIDAGRSCRNNLGEVRGLVIPAPGS